MGKSKEKCPHCGKNLKFLKKHIKKVHSSMEIPGKIPGKFQENSRENSRKDPKTSFLKEINLKGEFDRMTETINPKKEEKKDPKYQCGACGGTFDEKYKRCPHCGAEF